MTKPIALRRHFCLGVLVVWLAVVSGCRFHRPRLSTLQVVQDEGVLTLDPDQRFEFANSVVAMNLYDSLVRFDSNMNLVPEAAVSWETPNDRTWRFTLRPGLHFQDGSPLTAADVVFTIHRVLSQKGSELTPLVAGITAVRAIDPQTVEVTTGTPNMLLLPRLAFIYILPKKLLEKEGDTVFFQHPIGSGPYRFVARRPDTIEVAAFHGFWGRRPSIQRVNFRYADSVQQQWAAVASGRPTILLDAPRAGWETHLKDGKFEFIIHSGLTVSYLEFNVTPRPGNPLADVRVREAVRLALDIPELIQKTLSGHDYPASQLVPPDVIGYNPAITIPGRNLTRARQLLAEAGYLHGFDLAFDEEVGSTSAFQTRLLDHLREVGIHVTIKSWPEKEFFDRMDKGLSELHIIGWSCASGDSAELLEACFHSRQKQLGRDNASGYSNPEFDRLVESLSSINNPARRVAVEQQAMAILMRDLPAIPLLIEEDRYVVTHDVQWHPRADAAIWLPEASLK